MVPARVEDAVLARLPLERSRGAEARRQLLAVARDRAAAAARAVARRIVGQAMDAVDVVGVAKPGRAAPGERAVVAEAERPDSPGTMPPCTRSPGASRCTWCQKVGSGMNGTCGSLATSGAPLALRAPADRPVVAAAAELVACGSSGSGTSPRGRVAGRRRVPRRLGIETPRHVVAQRAAHGVEGELVLERR